MSRAPAVVTVRVSVEPAADNRAVHIVAESPTFFTSSEIPIEGTNGTPSRVIEFRNLPTGVYEVTATLVGANGPRATVLRMVKVAPPFGSQ